MIFYALIYAAYFAMLGGYVATRFRAFAFLGFAVLVIVAAFRGDVGTDTWVYSGYFDDIRQNGCGQGELEPLFCAYSWLLTQLFSSNWLVQGFNALVIAALLYFPLRRHYTRQLLSLLLIVPVSYLDFAMNGVRAGLAYSLMYALTVHLAFIGRRQTHTAPRKSVTFFAACISTAIHASSVVLAAMLHLLKQKFSAGRTILAAVLVPTFAVLVVAAQPQLLIRALSSLESEPFSALSGYAPALLNMLLLYAGIQTKAFTKRTAVALAVLNLLSLALARYTYNGIRVLQLIYFVESVAISLWSTRRPTLGTYAVICLIVAATLTLKVKNWGAEAELAATPTPFIPYSTFVR